MKKKLLYNTTSSFALQIITIICGFILPRFFIKEYGSEVNGLVSSITQFLSVISFLELGVGAVIQSSLYKPLAQNNTEKISAVYIAGSKFFRRIACILLAYVIVLVVIYPIIIDSAYDWLSTALLILAISISLFAQYCFGIMDRILLVADQRGYVAYNSQIITLIANAVLCITLIRLGATIYVVKLATSLVYLARPVMIRLYVNSHYKLSRSINIQKEPLQQKWDAVTQHIANVVLNDTDTVVLSLFSTLSNVSIYSVYYMVVSGLKTLILSVTNGIQSVIGEMYAKNEQKKLQDFFSVIEYGLHTAIVLVFTVAAVLIVPFVSVYTKDVADVDYAQPLFAVILVTAHAFHCLRDPYHILIKAAGHFRQTSKCYIIAAALNIVVSVIAVKAFGLVGVAVGTLVAMLYQTIWMVSYSSKNIIKFALPGFVKQCVMDAICCITIVLSTCRIKMIEQSFAGWMLLAVEVFVIAIAVVLLINMLLCHRKIKAVLAFLKRDESRTL